MYTIAGDLFKIKGLPLKVKSFQNTAAYQKLLSPLPPPPFVPRGGGVWTCVYVRGLAIWLVYVGGLTIELTYLLTTRYA